MNTNTSLFEGYQSMTLQSTHIERLSLLPSFPPLPLLLSSQTETTETGTKHDKTKRLLLANIPVTLLSASQRALRHIDTFPHQFEYVEHENVHVPSFFKFIYRNFIRDLSRKLKVSESILDFNLVRLNEITQQIALTPKMAHSTLNAAYHMHEWPIALEIFLQIDVDSFFMKTCTFRGSHPRTVSKITSQGEGEGEGEEGLFCLDRFDAGYLMLPCNNSLCTCCYQVLDISRRPSSSVQFAKENGHRFVNGYSIYLNGHASCKTTNFLYVLTCPCGQFDFIGSSRRHSNETFKDVLFHHRRQSTRLLHEFLLGEKIIQRTQDIYEREKTLDEKNADQMFLYRHLTQCSVAIQLLLNRTAIYWPFIPMDRSEADQESDETLEKQQTNEENSGIFTLNSEISTPYERTDQEVAWCLANLPATPDGTRFSRVQINKQKIFFKHAWDLFCLPPRHLDLFDMTLVFLLPDECSPLLCQVIESLLMTHAECKLNTTGHLANDQRPLSNTTSWYKNLVGRTYKY